VPRSPPSGLVEHSSSDDFPAESSERRVDFEIGFGGQFVVRA
jgi:hypothetical protein